MNDNTRRAVIQIPKPSSTVEGSKRIEYTVSTTGERSYRQGYLTSFSEILESLISFQFKTYLGETERSFIPEKSYRTHEINKIYSIRRRHEVFQFLVTNPHLEDIVLKLYNKIRMYFSTEKLSLEVITDTEDQSSHLVIFIQTHESPQDANDKFDRFDREWWFDISTRKDVSGKLTVTPVFE